MIGDYGRHWVLARMFGESSCKPGNGFVSNGMVAPNDIVRQLPRSRKER